MSGNRILVVDDDADIVEYVCTFLEDNGYEVRSADASDSAITALEEFPADVVLLDVLMPGRSGLDLLVTLRKDARWRDVPVVMVTGDDEVLADGGESYLAATSGLRGADEVLGKPLDLGVLLATLERLGTR